MAKQIFSAKDAAQVIKATITHEEQEELIMISLSGNNEIKDIHLIGLGSDNAVVISQKVIAKHAVLDMARSVIIAHNHPSGNPLPSKADIEQTARVRAALNLFDIQLTDHIIVCKDCYYSFSEEGKTSF